ncbi:uncharacterized protein LOC131254893 [Magnolia sinica]|uniref:uncharacterized protein LOC131254893 n=1 Tax=Magnolia sinica TaxID=86752 RepID=UPI00265AF2E0|nr:uncharacterized protein LOC131254893 [Magnolia sinica]
MFLPADLFVMPMAVFDVILGMDWLTEYYFVLDCATRIVTFHIPGLPVLQFVAEPRGEPLSSLLACLMNEVFQPFLDQFVVVFIDDILVYLRTREDKVEHWQVVLETIRAHQLYLKLEKCEFL